MFVLVLLFKNEYDVLSFKLNINFLKSNNYELSRNFYP